MKKLSPGEQMIFAVAFVADLAKQTGSESFYDPSLEAATNAVKSFRMAREKLEKLMTPDAKTTRRTYDVFDCVCCMADKRGGG